MKTKQFKGLACMLWAIFLMIQYNNNGNFVFSHNEVIDIMVFVISYSFAVVGFVLLSTSKDTITKINFD